ncbi:nicotinate-nucleotide adenylyltransferase [Clostridium acetobutylicum]|uniref:Probable nicotinate-nucleotide adenylyltransferase n=1 Tax=Clostridium acetobutylicum (strain ATCC 824 / DSM 792 / JCM 1419 / IAM 19013 / LMG 5710 / NBRC 13948 / NRRL B-527 / VKM B-1787 / 2291 / W) TaxID=272562 RepID=Q97I72_CLOAB|nr:MULTISPECIES: nicotinate (nicotinamide) nucleotide adenylyltransferase [Clostridium]AAK79746.1 Predicted nucleotidyltransferase [Clostridium acetobutylicum ATCC 824]ADZ20831.1 nucleotidyltransferase [Clostridium acetobutylicum EA 2018]AEI34562.1 nucleotidyltransferase [Clostridium acetobutylicum DSM 1731]AWV79819.1 nicotinate (nicotinamide) nucleotide adenylyltransferase [Clostridium acetobutylicum]MBC2394199.1 nicotinate (nicotinamide) nucleotide adenylyltransferase [Clostridium acetobutyl
MHSNNIILVYGGAFNPPSASHITLAKQLLNYTGAKKLMFVPVGNQYKKKELIPAYHRINMLQIACECNNRLEVNTTDVDFKRRLYTIETLEIIKKQNSDKDIYFIIGTDNLRDILNWKHWQRLLTEYKIIVMDRGEDTIFKVFKDIPILKKYKANLIQIPGLLVNNISSTLIRNNIRQDKTIEHLTIKKIIKYIKENNLYK